MGILTHALTQSGKLINTTTNEYGDQVSSGDTTFLCRFRYITEIDRGGINREAVDAADAIIWVEPSIDLQDGSIIQVNGKYWRVERLIRAARLTDATVLFKKAFVRRHELFVEEES